MSSAPAGSTGPTNWTPPTPRSSTRSRVWPSTGTCRWRTSRAPSTISPGRCSGRNRGPGCGRRSSRSPSRARRWTSTSRTRRAAPAGWSGVAAAWSIPNVLRRLRSRPGRVERLRLRHGHRTHPAVPQSDPGHARPGRGRRPVHRRLRIGGLSHASVTGMAGRRASALPPGTTHRRRHRCLAAHRVRGRRRAHRRRRRPGRLVVGTVLSIEELTGLKKPIRFCTVDVGPGNGPDGSDEPRGIICGATNFVESATPWWWRCRARCCPAGSPSPPAQTYGRISDGMICSTRELGIGTEHDGILVIGPIARARHRRPAADRLRRRGHRAGDHPGPRLRAVDPRAGPGTGRGVRLAVHRPGRARRPAAGRRRLAGDDRRPGGLRAVRHGPGAGHRSRPRRARSGCAAGCPPPASGRSRWPSTSPTTSCSISVSRCTPSTPAS